MEYLILIGCVALGTALGHLIARVLGVSFTS